MQGFSVGRTMGAGQARQRQSCRPARAARAARPARGEAWDKVAGPWGSTKQPPTRPRTVQLRQCALEGLEARHDALQTRRGGTLGEAARALADGAAAAAAAVPGRPTAFVVDWRDLKSGCGQAHRPARECRRAEGGRLSVGAASGGLPAGSRNWQTDADQAGDARSALV